MKLVISGNTPSQKNRKIISMNRATNKPFLRSAPAVKDWQEQALVELQTQFRGFQITDFPINVRCVIYFGNKRRHDLDNALSSVMDALVASGVIPDDNVDYVHRINVEYGGYDKQNPRVEIFLDD